MARPGYMSLYADERTQQIFDEFVKEKGITKATALSEMLEIYMLSQDEQLYLMLKKKMLGVDIAKQMLVEKMDTRPVNDYIFMKLGIVTDTDGNDIDGEETIEAYIRNNMSNGLGYSWFSTESLYFGMAKDKIKYYNRLIERGETVKILFSTRDNEISYTAIVRGIASGKEQIECPGPDESRPDVFENCDHARIWIKISEIKPENALKAAMFNIRSTDSNLKQVISSSQFCFGYVYLP